MTILLADDNADDRVMMRSALSRSGVAARLQMVKDGMEVLRYLQGEGPYADRRQYPMPEMLILDMKMPRLDGNATLEKLQADRELSRIPVIIISGMSELHDVKRAYELGARTFFVKPIQADDFRHMMEFIPAGALKKSRSYKA